jgi:hypothetical protein
MGEEIDEGLKQQRLTSILGRDMMHYWSLIDQVYIHIHIYEFWMVLYLYMDLF